MSSETALPPLEQARSSGEHSVEAEALRRLAVLHHRRNVARMEESRHWWRPEVYAAFLRSVGARPQLA
ncbi:MAG TPA: hypothetical protein VIQ27_03920 [Gemmatimonadales bacterium]